MLKVTKFMGNGAFFGPICDPNGLRRVSKTERFTRIADGKENKPALKMAGQASVGQHFSAD